MGVASIKQEVNPENKKLYHLFNNLKEYIFIYLFFFLLHEEARSSREAYEVVLCVMGGDSHLDGVKHPK